MRNETYHCLAQIIDYPGEGFNGLVARTIQLVSPVDESVAEYIKDFRDQAATDSLDALQELYTHTFDINPVCTLDVGYHIFGESYQRGAFLSHLREAESDAGLKDERELPDHLGVLLRFLPLLSDAEFKQSLISDCILPAIAKMEQALTESHNPYLSVLRAAELWLEREAQMLSASPDKRIE